MINEKSGTELKICASALRIFLVRCECWIIKFLLHAAFNRYAEKKKKERRKFKLSLLNIAEYCTICNLRIIYT